MSHSEKALVMPVVMPNTNTQATDNDRPNLEHSRGFHLYLVTKNKDLLDGCNAVLLDCFLPNEIRTFKKRGAARKVMRRLVMSLYKEWELDPEKFITVSLNNSDWAKNGRYGKLGISPHLLRKAIKRLEENGYISLFLGDIHWDKENRKQTRVRALPKLIEAIHHSQVKGETVKNRIRKDKRKYLADDDRPRTILKDENKNPIPIKRKPSDVVEGEGLLEKYQALLDKTSIISPIHGEIEPYDKFQYRTFNNGTFKHNGRVLGGFWQTIGSKLRSQIVIDGQGTTEIDIQGTFPVLVYHMLGIDYWQEYTDKDFHAADPYYLAGYTDDETYGKAYRRILKVVFNSAVNTTNSGNNLGWLTKLIREEAEGMSQADPPKISLEEMERISETAPVFIKKFIFERHPLLKDFFFNADIGMQAMNAESRVAMKVIEKFVQLGKPVLTVYDSFIVKQEDRATLGEVIINAYWEVIGFTPFFKQV
jgi:hypothetical protein